MTLPAHSKAPEDDVRQVLRKQVTQGALYQVVRDLFYDRKCVDELATVVTTLAQDHGTVEAAQYRDAVGLGRKRAIQILEFFDRVGHTRRFRDSRVLRPDSTWPMLRRRPRGPSAPRHLAEVAGPVRGHRRLGSRHRRMA